MTPGFTSTAACESALTFIDGDEGVLLHRGYPIDQLASQSNFIEVCHLLLHGELPTAAQYEKFENSITMHTMLHAQFDRFFEGFRRDAHPMSIMVGTVGALSAFYHDSLDIHDPVQRDISAIRLIAKMPTIAARAYKYHIGQPFISPRNDLSYAENFLRMCFAVPAEDYVVDPALVRAMDRIFTLHADHEQNASTSTVRLAGSSGANPFACIAAGIACLWGPSHGGANEEALNMLKEIGTPDRIPEFIQGVKDKKYKLMGFGHRVYKNYDPRAKVMQQSAYEVLAATGRENDPAVPGRQGTGARRPVGRVFHLAQAVPERRLLLGHHPVGDGLPDHHVHRPVRPGPHRGLDLAVAGNDGRSLAEDRSPASALHRPDATRLRADRTAWVIKPRRVEKAKPFVRGPTRMKNAGVMPRRFCLPTSSETPGS